MPSFGWLVKTVRDASRFRFNAIHLTITLETVKYLAGNGRRADGCADGKAEVSRGVPGILEGRCPDGHATKLEAGVVEAPMMFCCER